MSLAENISERLSYKAYSSGVITAGTEPVPSVAPAASGGQQLRYVSQNLSVAKDTYASTEKRTDRQISDFRHGQKKVTGTISGLLSPATYGDLFQAASRGTWAAAVTASNTDFTSVSANNGASTFTFGGGDPVAKGFRVGHILRFANLSDAGNNAKNFLILGFGGGSNRTVTVYPAPDTMTADTAFTVSSTGKSLIVPSSGHVSRLFAFESYNTDIDTAQLFTECRVGGFSLNLPATGLTTADFTIMGRDRVIYENTNAPFFTSPAVQTTTGQCAAVDGLLSVGGKQLGVVTGVQMTFDMSPNAPAVAGTNLPPEIFLGSADVKGQFSAFFEDTDLISDFDEETELQLLCYLSTGSAVNADAISILLPRIKLSSAAESDDGSGGKIVQYNFQALKYQTASTGIENTTIQICDTAQT